MKIMFPAIFLLFSQLAMGQDQEPDLAVSPAPSTNDEQSAQETLLPQQYLEEITVRGDRTFISIRNQIERAEDNLYSLFNELNSDDDFDIFCRDRKRLSHIARRECEPMFLTRARQINSIFALQTMRDSFSAAGDFEGVNEGISGDFSALNGSPMFQFGLDMLMSEHDLAGSESTKFEALQTEMLRIATENPEYLKALMEVGKLKQVLQQERRKRFGIP